MGRKGYQNERVIINVTPAQLAAVDSALKKEIDYRREYYEADPENHPPPPSKNDVLLWMLQALCEDGNIEWPEHVKAQGKRTDLDTP